VLYDEVKEDEDGLNYVLNLLVDVVEGEERVTFAWVGIVATSVELEDYNMARLYLGEMADVIIEYYDASDEESQSAIEYYDDMRDKLLDYDDSYAIPSMDELLIDAGLMDSNAGLGGPEGGTTVYFESAILEAAVKASMDNNGYTYSDLMTVEEASEVLVLELSSSEIESLTGFEAFENLEHLDLMGNLISDLTPLAGLTHLNQLTLWDNYITDITPLAGLTNLEYLDLEDNFISDLSPLSSLTNMYVLIASYNNIVDVSPLSNLTKLFSLYLDGNDITDYTPLDNLINLEDTQF
jgi:hypothetical protein